ncbi:MAG: trehalose-phosphatase [Gemmatimonadetes bacterium]|nr:trehalose-phosphatase [Gemmatimonadota bacterium]
MRPPPPCVDWAYFFDIDGTLAELAATPASAQVSPVLQKRFADLQTATGGAVAVVSGRALEDIDAIFGRPLPAAGQHGAERRDARGRVHQTSRARRAAIHRARAAIVPAIAAQPGLLLEEKGHALALHYRAAPRLGPMARRLMRVQQQRLGPQFAVLNGKCVVELLPAGVDKGSAIRAFLNEAPFRGRRPVFLGDDVTDEAGFVAVNALGGVSIKVGAGATGALFRLADVRAVERWLVARDAPAAPPRARRRT